MQPTYLQSVKTLLSKQQTTVHCVHSAQITFVVKKYGYTFSQVTTVSLNTKATLKKMHRLQMPKKWAKMKHVPETKV